MGEVYHNMFNETCSKERVEKISTRMRKENKEILERVEKISCEDLLRPLKEIRFGLSGLEYKNTTNLMDQR